MKTLTGYRKGVDLGGWFSQREYTKEYFDTFITEKDMDVLAGWGIDHVRLPVDYNVFETEEGEYKEEGFEYVDRVIGWVTKRGLNLVLDLHKTAGFSFDKEEKQEGFFESEALQERFYRLWEQFARRYGKYGDAIAFELLNEVTDKEYCDIWNAIANECVRRIRVFCPETKILLGGYWNNSVEAVKDIAMPVDENIVYNFHCYSPLAFTHQSAYWIDGMPSDFHLGYPADVAEYTEAVKTKAPSMVEFGGDTELERYCPEYFEGLFAEAVRIAEERGVALYCGEYGVINKADPEDILRWYMDINAAFEKYGIGRAAWSYRAVDFGLADEHMASVIDRLVKYL